MFSNLTASYDPVFWPVHVNVDRLWWEWQTRNPTGVPYDLDSVLSPWSYTIRDMLDISRFGYEYVRCSFFMPVGMEAPIAPLRVEADQDQRARRRNSARPRSACTGCRSWCARASCAPSSTSRARTPRPTIRDNPHYAGYLAIFGHGDCYGGPGHCDLPPSRARAFDERPRSHNTPRNHRLDVTKAVQRMLQDRRSSEVQITLLVIGVDYREEKDLLRLEGVSLNFSTDALEED